MITKADLLEDFEYNPITGLFVRKTSKGKWKSGEIAGGIDAHGYVKIRVKNSKYAAHRLAFLYMTGEIPNMIDHINRIKSDNRWENLRACDASENAANRSVHSNNSLGIKGVAWVESRNRFTGTIMSKGKTMSKDFKSLTEAVEWVDSKRVAIHKEFANNG